MGLEEGMPIKAHRKPSCEAHQCRSSIKNIGSTHQLDQLAKLLRPVCALNISKTISATRRMQVALEIKTTDRCYEA